MTDQPGNSTDRRCGTCRWLRVEPDKNGRRVVRRDKIYRCLFEPAWPPLPAAITKSYGFRLPVAIVQGMCGDEGKDCPTWEALNV